MLKLSDVLQLQTRRYRVKPRFFFIIAVLILTILCILAWDKLAGIVPETFCTSVYWKGVF